MADYRWALQWIAVLSIVFCISQASSLSNKHDTETDHSGNTVTTKDGATIYYKDFGTGRPVVFSHGWPLSADAWDAQMFFFLRNGYRVIAHDRRSHGRSSQESTGNDMDTYADDLALLLDHLEVQGAILVGHSTGGGEIVRYMARHGTGRVSKAVLLAAATPLLLRTAANPEGVPLEEFDGYRTAFLKDRSQYLIATVDGFYGQGRPGFTPPSKGIKDHYWLMGIQGGLVGQYDCIKAFSETDYTEDLKKIDKPVLVMHTRDDLLTPFDLTAAKTMALLKERGTLKEYPVGEGYSHGMATTKADVVNKDLLEFIKIDEQPWVPDTGTTTAAPAAPAATGTTPTSGAKATLGNSFLLLTTAGLFMAR